MSHGLDNKTIQDSYARMSDNELIRLLTEDGIGLTDGAKEIALEEAKRRNLSTGLQHGIATQQRAYLASEVDELCATIQKLSCPNCGSNSVPLNGTLISETISLIVFTNMRRKAMIACPSCLDKAMTGAMIKTSLLGWWGFPWGLIRTPQALIRNAKHRKMHHQDGPNEVLLAYVTANAAKITVLKEDKARLQQAISI